MKSIAIKEETKERLESFGKFNESFDELINRLLDQITEKN
jgi:predicted CopG family antitoxin